MAVLTELRAERVVHGGVAIAREEGGEVVLVSGALPGERVAAGVTRLKGVLRGEVVDVLEPSPHRVDPPTHPGLDFGHVAYPYQLELKRAVVEDALKRSGAAAAGSRVEEVRPSPSRWRYRSVVQPAVTRVGAELGLGYRRRGSDEVVTLATDPVASEAVDAAWQVLVAAMRSRGGQFSRLRVREMVIRANDDLQALVALVGSGDERRALDLAHALVAEGLTGVAWAPFDPRGRFRRGTTRLAGRRTVLQSYGPHTLSVSATSFSQPNPAAASGLYAELASWAGRGLSALELYSGGGAISFHLSDRFESVTAVEVDSSAVARGRADAERLGIGNVSFEKSDARSVSLDGRHDVVVVDPPRAGLSADLRRSLAGSSAGRLVYVSCDPATWARDVADLTACGWTLQRVAPYDFYPHTHHVEVLSLLERQQG